MVAKSESPVDKWFIPIITWFQPYKVMRDFARIHRRRRDTDRLKTFIDDHSVLQRGAAGVHIFPTDSNKSYKLNNAVEVPIDQWETRWRDDVLKSVSTMDGDAAILHNLAARTVAGDTQHGRLDLPDVPWEQLRRISFVRSLVLHLGLSPAITGFKKLVTILVINIY